tara:strand:+ start:487 stop:1566 length:1080 start_codon:yes stop_codon:yes gene_type:complete
MSYLDPKEQVLDLQLTPYGKLLLSIGKLDPVFYAFFDNDIIYNGSNANINNETQSAIEPRIQEETPRFSAQANTDSIETDFATKGEHIELANEELAQYGMSLDLTEQELFEFYRRIPEPGQKALKYQPIGSYKNSNGAAPGWSAAFLKAPLSSSKNVLTVSGPKGEYNYNIPQLDVNIEYEIQRNSKKFTEKHIPEILYQEYDPTSLGQTAMKIGLDEAIGETIYENGASIFVTPDRLIIRLEESNTNYEKDNFEVEFFYFAATGPNGEENLIKLNFYKDYTLYSEDELQNKINGMAVERYFDLSVDTEIDPDIICPLIVKDKTKQFYMKKMFDCENIVSEGPVDNIYLDADDTEDICE